MSHLLEALSKYATQIITIITLLGTLYGLIRTLMNYKKTLQHYKGALDHFMEETKRQAQCIEDSLADRRQLRAGLVALLHQAIYELSTAVLDQGYITIDQSNDLNHLYDAYQVMGGNGTGSKLYKEAMELKTKKEVKKHDK